MLEIGIVASIVAGYLRGGSLSRLASIEIKFFWLAILAFFVQGFTIWLLKYQVVYRPAAFHLLLFSYLLLLIVVVFNLKNEYVLMVGFGIFLNFLVILLNGGMPVSLQVVDLLGMDADSIRISSAGSFKHVPLSSQTRLGFLGDIIPLPLPYPFPRGLFSIGDVFMTVGIFLLLQSRMVYRGKRVKRKGIKRN